MPKPIPPNAKCAHCGQPRKKHRLVNYAFGSVLICPTAVFTPKQEKRDA